MKTFVLNLLLMAIPCSLLSQVTVDYALTNNEPMKLKWGLTFSSGSLRKVTLSPFKITDIRKGKQQLVGRHRDAYLEIVGKDKTLRRSVVTTITQPFSLTILEEGGDTIISNIDLITVKGGNHALVEMRSGNAKEEESSVSYCEDIKVQTKADSLNWHMPAKNDQYTDYEDYPLQFDRVLTNGQDDILVKGADGFPVKRKAFENHTKGIVFIYKKKQIAALETYPETAMWFSKDIQRSHKEVIAGVIMSLLAAAPTVMK